MMKGKVAVLTGASSGIGKSLSSQLIGKVETLILLGRNRSALEEMVGQLKGAGVSAFQFEVDLNNEESVQNAIREIRGITNEIHFLINNAGLSQRSIATETESAVEQQIFQVNYFGPIALTKGLIGQLRNGKGKIIVVTSIVGKFGFGLRSSYSAAKHALHGYFESLRLEEEKHGVSVQFIVPGRIKTSVSMNALNGKGSAHQQMDEGQANGMSADTCAKKIVQAMATNKKEVLIGGKEILMVRLKKYLPSLFYRIARKEIQKNGKL